MGRVALKTRTMLGVVGMKTFRDGRFDNRNARPLTTGTASADLRGGNTRARAEDKFAR